MKNKLIIKFLCFSFLFVTVSCIEFTVNNKVDAVSAVTTEYVKSSNNNLASLTSDVVSIGFSPSKTTYYVTVNNNVTTINLKATPADSKATAVISGDSNFVVGTNKIIINVTAENGSVKYYYVYVTRNEVIKSANNSLLSLTSSVVSIAFEPNILEYNVAVINDVTSIGLIASPADSKATAVIIGDSNFVVGTNKIIINVTAENGTVKTYVINVDRKKSDNNNLSSLSVENVALSPTFNKDITEYEGTLTQDLASVVLNYTFEDNMATAIVTGNSNLVKGKNIINVIVKADSGLEKIYKITINKNSNNILLPVIIYASIIIIGAASTFFIIKKKKNSSIQKN